MVGTHTHTLTVRHRAVDHTDSVEVERHRIPVLVDMPHRGLAAAEHRKGLAEVECHMGFVVSHTLSMGPGWGSDSHYFSLLNLLLKHVLYRQYE